MKRFLFVLALFAAFSVSGKAQTVALPSASQPVVQLSWTIPPANSTTGWGGCTATAPCTFRPFRIAGACPSSLAGSTGWTQLADTGNNASTTTDDTATGQESYVVETIQNGLLSGPSNCATATVPNVPSPATNLKAQ